MKKSILLWLGLIGIGLAVYRLYTPEYRWGGILVESFQNATYFLESYHLEYYVVATDGSGEMDVRIPKKILGGGLIDWSPDGEWLVGRKWERTGDAAGRHSDLIFMRSDGSKKYILDIPGTREFGAKWSPDGKYVAFKRDREDDIFVLAVDCIINDLNCEPIIESLGSGKLLDWSPDGNSIVFTREDMYEIRHLNIMQIESGEVKEIFYNLNDCRSADWGAKGLLMSCDNDIYLLSEDGIVLKNLTQGEGYNWNVSWSPDGTQIAFVSRRGDKKWGRIVDQSAPSSPYTANGLFIMDADGSNVRRLPGREIEIIRWYVWLPNIDE